MSIWTSMKRYFKKHPIVLAICIICIIIHTLINLTPPLIMKYFVDNGLVKGNKDVFLICAVLYFGSYIVMHIFNFGKNICTAIISQ